MHVGHRHPPAGSRAEHCPEKQGGKLNAGAAGGRKGEGRAGEKRPGMSQNNILQAQINPTCFSTLSTSQRRAGCLPRHQASCCSRVCYALGRVHEDVNGPVEEVEQVRGISLNSASISPFSCKPTTREFGRHRPLLILLRCRTCKHGILNDPPASVSIRCTDATLFPVYQEQRKGSPSLGTRSTSGTAEAAQKH